MHSDKHEDTDVEQYLELEWFWKHQKRGCDLKHKCANKTCVTKARSRASHLDLSDDDSPIHTPPWPISSRALLHELDKDSRAASDMDAGLTAD